MCCRITRTGDAAETEMPPRKQKRLLLIDPIVATTAFYAAWFSPSAQWFMPGFLAVNMGDFKH